MDKDRFARTIRTSTRLIHNTHTHTHTHSLQIALLEKRIAELSSATAAPSGQKEDKKEGPGPNLQAAEIERLKAQVVASKEACSKAEKERDSERQEAARLREALKAYKDESDACNDRLIKQVCLLCMISVM